ncbi:NACHT, LRR and PYD domains-containing protein 5-like isoform X2 [Acipenser ruthenus]|uniref:NACHT, LRR and PYD domains-containing protein 5-like isoform X2 n=1 Tax=Acipenser ruthenus TaxID=7906 RepID=UPI002740BADF|nr:NACHT, LRR and PYD domains-containing protein 5-like isoform X2 [Acipenser ruthenus]
MEDKEENEDINVAKDAFDGIGKKDAAERLLEKAEPARDKRKKSDHDDEPARNKRKKSGHEDEPDSPGQSSISYSAENRSIIVAPHLQGHSIDNVLINVNVERDERKKSDHDNKPALEEPDSNKRKISRINSSHLTKDTVMDFCQMLSTHPCRVSLGLDIKMTKEGLTLSCFTCVEMVGEEGLSIDGDLPEDFILNICTLIIPKYICPSISVCNSHLTSNFIEKLCGVLKMSTIDRQSPRLEFSYLTEDRVMNFCQMLSTQPSWKYLSLFITMTKDGLRLDCITGDSQDCEEGLLFHGDLPEDFIWNVCTLIIPKYYCERLTVCKSHLTSNFIEKLCGVLKMSTTDLRFLVLTDTHLTDSCAESLSSGLDAFSSLQYLDLSKNSFTDSSVPSLINIILKCTSLMDFKMEFSHITEDAVMNFCQMLSTNPSPKPLCLNIQMSKEGLRLSCYTDNRWIKEKGLLFHGDLPEDFIWNVCTLIIPKYKCKKISVCNSHLTSNFMEKLCGVLKMSTSDLQSLELTDAHLTDSCVESLASGLDAFSPLESLDLSKNSFTDSSVPSFIHIMLMCSNLRSFKLTDAHLTDRCVESLSSGLDALISSLKYLDLSNNSFTDSSVPSFIHIMLKCANLTDFKLKGNQFSPDGKKKLNVKEELQRCGCLLTVYDCSHIFSDWSRNQQEYKRQLTLWI